MAWGHHRRGRHLIAIRVVHVWLNWWVAWMTTHHYGVVGLLKGRIHCWHHGCVNHIISFGMSVNVWLRYVRIMITVRFPGFHGHFIAAL